MLNIRKSSCRQMHDTFYLNDKDYLLRTLTSPVQVRCMLEKKPPMAFISGGRFLER